MSTSHNLQISLSCFLQSISAKCLLYSVQLFSPFVSTNSHTLCSTDYGKLFLVFTFHDCSSGTGVSLLLEVVGGGGYTVSRNRSHTWLPYQACDSGTVIFLFCLPGITGGSKHFQEITITVTDATKSPCDPHFQEITIHHACLITPAIHIFQEIAPTHAYFFAPVIHIFEKSQSQTTTSFPANCSMYANSCAVLSPEIPTLSRIHCRSWLPRNTQQKNASPSSQARTRRSENVLRLWIATDLPKLKVIWNSTRPRALVQKSTNKGVN